VTADTRVVVVGGGLAGITAALRLADAGCHVTLLESKPKLGGLTHSFRRGSLDIDNGQHVFMRCCTAYRALLDRLGMVGATTLQRRLDVAVVRATDGRRARLRRDNLPPPLHLARSLATYSVLSAADRGRVIRGALAMRRVDRDAPPTDDVAFGAWLRAHGQNDAAIAALWDLVGVATINLRAADASLAVAATVFQVGLLTDADAADIGWSLVPLQRLHGDAATSALAHTGAAVHTRTKVESVDATASGWVVRTTSDDIDADAVVVAADPAHAGRLLPDDALDLPSDWAERLGMSPIVNVHMVWDRRVMSSPFVAATGGPVQWVFDRTAQSGLDAGQYLAVSLSAADDVISQSVADLRATFVPAVQQLLPAARQARLLDFFVTREPAATFRAAPGSARLRPGVTTRRRGLYVAGAHTATGWPATMESAVRSGDAAAAAVLGAAARRGEAVLSG
jgi:squalene-associated FAD-dependent desaturase